MSAALAEGEPAMARFLTCQHLTGERGAYIACDEPTASHRIPWCEKHRGMMALDPYTMRPSKPTPRHSFGPSEGQLFSGESYRDAFRATRGKRASDKFIRSVIRGGR